MDQSVSGAELQHGAPAAVDRDDLSSLRARLVPEIVIDNGRYPRSLLAVFTQLTRFAPFLLVPLMLIPVLAVHLPPFVDLLGHIGRYALQAGLEDHSWLRQYYDVHWQVIGNLGADILVQVLSPTFDVETSARIVVVLNQLLATAGILLVCREVHGRITSYCLFALPLIYGLPFSYGFINFTLSMALALLAFALWLRLGRLGRFGVRSWLFVPLSLGIWLCHTYGWAFLGLLCAAESLVRWREAGRDWPTTVWNTAWSCLPLAAPLAPLFLWQRGQPLTADSTGGWFALGIKLRWLLSILRVGDEAADVFSAAILFGLAYVGLQSSRLSRDRRMVAAATLCLVAFVILPLQALGSTFADMRLAPYMMIIALLAISDGELARRPRKWLMVAGILFLVVRVALCTTTYTERERILDQHLEALDAIPERARVATLVSLPCPNAWELPWLEHVGSMTLARKRAFVNDQWAKGTVNLLSVHYPAAGSFATDPAQLVSPRNCDGDTGAMRQSLMALPAKAFTHVWIVGLPPRAQPSRPDLTLIWQGPESAVYKVAGPVSQVAGAIASTTH